MNTPHSIPRRQFLRTTALLSAAPAFLSAGAAGEPGLKRARILLVTGIDYPGHLWKETAPVLAGLLQKDSRLAVTTVEDPALLDSSGIHSYDAMVFHWMNWEQPAPGAAARQNLQRFVEGGKGLMLIHFACGAFQDWPEFQKLAGRVYDPKLRPHDPRGPFQVKITDAPHAVTRGMRDFDTDDELYTCLAGDRPITVLATARSKVDSVDYPMAFVLECGKGRVFHSPLGHDVKALSAPGVGDLFRRGCAWIAGF